MALNWNLAGRAPSFADMLAAPEAGRAMQQDIDRQAARVTAGNAYTAGDRMGAARTLAAAGELADATAVTDRVAADTRTREQEQRALADKARLREAQAWKAVEAPIRAAMQKPDGAKHVPVILQQAVRQAGGDEADLRTVMAAYEKDPEAFVSGIVASAERTFEEVGGALVETTNPDDMREAYRAPPKEEAYTLTPGSVRYDAQGNIIAAVPMAPKPGEWRERDLPGGGSEFFQLPGEDAGADWLQRVTAAAPNARVTSGYRTPEHNRRVGGVEGSRHTRNEAVDLVPQPGETMAQLHARVRGVPGTRAINEGDHVHVQTAGGANYSGARRGGPAPAPAAPARAGGRTIPGSAPKPPAGEKALTPLQIRNFGMSLRKEFSALPDVKDYNNIAASYETIARIAKQPPTPANDMSLIFSYMKVLDPGSVVREGEYANAANTAGVPDQIVNLYNKVLSGQRLNPKQREQFAQAAGNIYQAREGRYQQLVAQYQREAELNGLPPTVIQGRQPARAAGGGGGGAPGARPAAARPNKPIKQMSNAELMALANGGT